ncbi:MAG: Wzz/FepE/Etk N-terminal domain-containing protein [Terracidiphilus sp.]
MSTQSEERMLRASLHEPPEFAARAAPQNWVANTAVLWDRRKTLARVAAIALAVNLVIAFTIPKRYESTARIMPPDSSNSGTAMLAALAGRSMGGGLDGLGALAASFLGMRGSSALFVDLLRSGTVADDLITRFDLQKAYHKRYRVDTAKYLARHTSIVDDKKSGVITVTVTDTDPRRARDLAQAYLDELNQLVTRTSTSSAHRERVFIERRLDTVKNDLEHAQQGLSDFSSTHAAVDIREQTRAMVDAGAKIEGELIATQGELDSLRQIYGDGNVRVRSAEVRLADLKAEIAKMGGSSAQLPTGDAPDAAKGGSDSAVNVLYPSLRQLPRLAVPYADLYRTVRVQETVFEMLTQQYEIARIQEAKDIPVVSVIDTPGIPEKKSFPPRLLLSTLLTLLVVGLTAASMLFAHRWSLVEDGDPRRQLAAAILKDTRAGWSRMVRLARGPR